MRLVVVTTCALTILLVAGRSDAQGTREAAAPSAPSDDQAMQKAAAAPAPAPAPASDPPPTGAPVPAAAPGASADLNGAAKQLATASEKLDAASKKLEQASSKLASNSESKELLAGRVPWNGAFLKFSEKDKKATVAGSYPVASGSWVVNAELSVPLDEATRRAPLLVDATGQPAAFQVKLALDYNAMQEYLEDLLKSDTTVEESRVCRAYMKETGDQLCPSEGFYRWRRSTTHPQRLESPFARGVPVGVRYTVGAEIGASFDRQDVYSEDLASKPVKLTKSDFTAGVVARFYPSRWLAIPIRFGGGFEDGFRAKEVERCASSSSTDSGVTGRECKKVLFLQEDEALRGKGYVDTALVFAIPVPIASELQPGLEARARIDGLFATEIMRLSTTMFFTPTTQPISLRFGAGFEYTIALENGPGTSPDVEKGDRTLSPFLLVGASL